MSLIVYYVLYWQVCFSPYQFFVCIWFFFLNLEYEKKSVFFFPIHIIVVCSRAANFNIGKRRHEKTTLPPPKIKTNTRSTPFLNNSPPLKKTGNFLFISLKTTGELENTVLNQLFVWCTTALGACTFSFVSAFIVLVPIAKLLNISLELALGQCCLWQTWCTSVPLCTSILGTLG